MSNHTAEPVTKAIAQRCACCGVDRKGDEPTCLSCGEASWVVVGAVAVRNSPVAVASTTKPKLGANR